MSSTRRCGRSSQEHDGEVQGCPGGRNTRSGKVKENINVPKKRKRKYTSSDDWITEDEVDESPNEPCFNEDDVTNLVEEQILSVEEQAMKTSDDLFGEPTKFSESQKAAVSNEPYEIQETVSDFNSEGSAAQAELELYKIKCKELESRNKELSEKGPETKNVKDKLDIIQEAALCGVWGSLIFQSLKYANDNALAYENSNGILKKAFVCLGLETEGQREAQKDAVRNYMKYRISRMRDYFVTKVHIAVLNMDKSLVCDLSESLATMNKLRSYKHISEISETMKKMWTWYGLNLMVGVSRKDWAWRSRVNRKTRLFSACVVVGDEALALQIIALRANKYIKDRDTEEAITDKSAVLKKKRGRKSYVTGDESTKVLTGCMSVFLRKREDIIRIRKSTPNDELGWERYLQDIEAGDHEGCTSEVQKGRPNAGGIGFSSCECPVDEVVGV